MSDITNQHLEAAIIDQKVAGEFAGKTYAFVAVINDGQYKLGVAVANEQGYSAIYGKTFDGHDEAKQWADGLNAHIGLSKDAALDIVGSSMFGRGKRVGG
ncbi:hypothetical protein KIP88_02450 [Bradyrhizobium sp. SRL28]|uniref:hypothetical protein n=1 Tax=Bradyrhizobium sp. SRL28 TaxID=2836178 RepID=UPI001BDE6CDD|nr:hypothetical protein [Bradyrhizobium sp. SRL28]MBT1509350.1 hypothetical protein [Bradyrhizobium sp. SRL28]